MPNTRSKLQFLINEMCAYVRAMLHYPIVNAAERALEGALIKGLWKSALALMLVTMCGCKNSVSDRSEAGSVPVLAIEASDSNLGTLWEGTTAYRIVRIHNTSADDVFIKDFITSCSCTSIEPRSLTVPAMGSGEITVAVEIPVDKESTDLRSASVRLSPNIENYNGPPIAWTLAGTPRGLVTLSREHVTLLMSRDEAGRAEMERVEVATTIPVNWLKPISSSKSIDVSIEELSDTKAAIVVLPAVQSAQRVMAADITLVGRLACGDEVLFHAVTVEGRFDSRVEVWPKTIEFGFVPLGKTVSREIVVLAPDNAPIACNDCSADSAEVSVESLPTDQNTVKYTVCLKASAIGPKEAMITINATTDRDQLTTLEVPVRYSVVSSN